MNDWIERVANYLGLTDIVKAASGGGGGSGDDVSLISPPSFIASGVAACQHASA